MAQPTLIRNPLSRQAQLILGFAAWATVVALWFLITHSQVLPPLALPGPAGVIQALGRLRMEYNLLSNVFMSWWRIAQAFLWCVVIAIPRGLLMASYQWLFHLI